MTNIKLELSQRKTSGHESVMQSLRMQQEALEEKIHMMSVMKVMELLYQIVDNKDVANTGAKYCLLHYGKDEDDDSLTMNFCFYNKDSRIIAGHGEFERTLSIYRELQINKLDDLYFAPNHTTLFEISKEGVELFTKTLLNDKLQSLMTASMEALLLEEAISLKPSLSKKKRSHKV